MVDIISLMLYTKFGYAFSTDKLCIHRCINVNIVELYGSAGQRGSGAAASMHSSLYKAGIIAQMFLLDNDDELKILLA